MEKFNDKYGAILTETNWDKNPVFKANPVFFPINKPEDLYLYKTGKNQYYKKNNRFINKKSNKTIGYFNIEYSHLYREINQADYLILALRRTQNFESTTFTQTIDNRLVIPDEYIKIKTINKVIEPNKLSLYGIVCFKGNDPKYGHYVGFYICKGVWYFYDDLGETTIRKIGTYQNLLDYNNKQVSTNGILFIYC